MRSLAPRPIVVISLSRLTPWNPATTATLPAASASRTRSPLTSTIFALRWTLSVMIPTWLPVKLMASTPSEARAIVTSAAETRSPVVSSMSISRPGCVLDTLSARAMRLSVALPIAETTTTTSLPRRLVMATFSATARMRSASATEVPPYFWTISATGATRYRRGVLGVRRYRRLTCPGRCSTTRTRPRCVPTSGCCRSPGSSTTSPTASPRRSWRSSPPGSACRSGASAWRSPPASSSPSRRRSSDAWSTASPGERRCSSACASSPSAR